MIWIAHNALPLPLIQSHQGEYAVWLLRLLFSDCSVTSAALGHGLLMTALKKKVCLLAASRVYTICPLPIHPNMCLSYVYNGGISWKFIWKSNAYIRTPLSIRLVLDFKVLFLSMGIKEISYTVRTSLFEWRNLVRIVKVHKLISPQFILCLIIMKCMYI